jgi:hypothetical protein
VIRLGFGITLISNQITDIMPSTIKNTGPLLFVEFFIGCMVPCPG